MSTEANVTAERLRLREHYGTLTDDDLARLALYEELTPAAREAITEELEARGLRDLSSFRKRFEKDHALAMVEGQLAFVPVSARPPAEKDRYYGLLGFTIFAAWGLIGVHKWLLGDATTWGKEESLALLVFWALVLTWDPMVRVVKGQASRKAVLGLILGWLYLGIVAAPAAVPAVGRFVSGFDGPLVLAILASPLFAFVIYSAVKRRRAERNTS